MTTSLLMERTSDFAGFARTLAAGRTLPFTPQHLSHVYVKLEFSHEQENSRTAHDARGFLRSVARAAVAAHLLAEITGGVLLEVQGSMLHVALPPSGDSVRDFAANLHGVYRAVFSNAEGRVKGWRMAADAGRTLVVAGRGVHGDDSFVSLGRSANRPAKHIYQQMNLPAEAVRFLKRFYLATHDRVADRWRHDPLDGLPRRLDENSTIVEAARSKDPQVEFQDVIHRQQGMTAQAAPIPGHAGSPTADRPHTYFGWVMRCDLDGFTHCVEACFDQDEKLQDLAQHFYEIMEQARQFVARQSEVLAQLPWAGDNFTAAALLQSKPDYEQAVPRRLVELSLDFEKDMAHVATSCGFGGWAQGVAGGDVHGNSNGNVYIAGIVVGGRRFLVGVGEGFGRSAQAFIDINPRPEDMVVYRPDWARLDEDYKEAFEQAIKDSGEPSALYMVANADGLNRLRVKRDTVPAATVVTVAPHRTQQVSGRPYSR